MGNGNIQLIKANMDSEFLHEKRRGDEK